MKRTTGSGLAIAFVLLFAACAVGPPAAPATPEPPAAPWIELFDGHSLGEWTSTAFGGEGEVTVTDGALQLDIGSPLTGVTWQGAPPSGDYELEATAARIEGTDFFCGLTFPVGDRHLTLVLGGWGGSVCGLSSLDDRDAARNDTRTLRGFRNSRDYTVRVTVTSEAVSVTLDGEPFLRTDLVGRAISLRPEVRLCRPLGIACFATRARVGKLRWRPLVR